MRLLSKLSPLSSEKDETSEGRCRGQYCRALGSIINWSWLSWRQRQQIDRETNGMALWCNMQWVHRGSGAHWSAPCRSWRSCKPRSGIPSHCHLSLRLSCLLPAAITASRYPIGSSLTATHTHILHTGFLSRSLSLFFPFSSVPRLRPSACLCGSALSSTAKCCLSLFLPLCMCVSHRLLWSSSTPWAYAAAASLAQYCHLIFSLPPSVICCASSILPLSPLLLTVYQVNPNCKLLLVGFMSNHLHR